jgi:glycosyltransferase involved in cell wall biosynthesis
MIVTGTGLAMGLASWNLLKNLQKRLILTPPAGGEPELVDLTLALPVRDEEANLRELLPQLLALEPRPREILFLDDGSSDGTSELLADAAARAPWVRVVRGAPLPSGWRGKVHALHQLFRETRTPYVLFIDADVRLADPGAVASIWETGKAHAAGRGGFFTVFPRPQVGLGAGLLVHQIHTHLFYFLPYFAKEWGLRSAVAGCGQVMLASVEALQEIGGFERIRGSTHDGLQLARAFSAERLPVDFADGGVFVSCRTYAGFADAFRGFSRNSFEGFGSPVAAVAVSAALFWVFVFPFVLAPFFVLNPVFAVAFLALLAAQWKMASDFGFGWSHVPLTPVKAGASIAVHLWSLTRAKLGIPQIWHGRKV